MSKVTSPKTKGASVIESPFLTVREAAQWLRCSDRKVWRLLRDKKLKKYQIGRRTLLKLSDLEHRVSEPEED